MVEPTHFCRNCTLVRRFSDGAALYKCLGHQKLEGPAYARELECAEREARLPPTPVQGASRTQVEPEGVRSDANLSQAFGSESLEVGFITHWSPQRRSLTLVLSLMRQDRTLSLLLDGE